MDFLEEFTKLKLTVPRAALFNTKSENSEYTQYAISNKNCYICYGSDYNEDCYYGYWIYTNKDSADISYTYDSELAYECTDIKRCFNLSHCADCTGCRDIFLCYDCIDSADCLGCVGLRHKEFHIFNKPYEKEKYKEEIARLKREFSTAEGKTRIMEKFAALCAAVPRVYMHNTNNENCTGDYIYNCKNCQLCFDLRECEDSNYCYNTFNLKNCSDASYAKDGELIYDSVSAVGINFNFCYICWYGANLDFCELCFNCQDCLGCIGLNKKRFCILNKQYGEEDYRKRAAEIKTDLRAKGWYGGRLPEIFWEG